MILFTSKTPLDPAGRILELAVAVRRSVSDSLYLALAVRQGNVLITGDERLVNALSGTPLAASARWIGAA